MILLSILIPSLPERATKLAELLACLAPQDCPELEIIVLTDNRRRSLGAKRNAMMEMAQGRYLCHIDDDEMLADDYIETVLPLISESVDLIAYDAGVSFNGGPEFRVTTGVGFPIEHPKPLGGERYTDIRRPPWHWSLWRADLARQFRFPDTGWTEDALWLQQIWPAVRTWRKIDRVLFFHRWSKETTTFK